jgi:hypothetical protein
MPTSGGSLVTAIRINVKKKLHGHHFTFYKKGKPQQRLNIFSKINTHTSFEDGKVSVASITPIPQVLVFAIMLLLIVVS